MEQTLTLRKAARLRKLIEARMSELRAQAQQLSAAVNIFDPKPLDEIDERAENFQKNYAKMNTLAEVLFALRTSVGAANHTAGVNALLTERAKVQTRLAFLHQIVRNEARLDSETIMARIAGMRDKNANAVAYNDNLHFDVLPQEVLDSLKAEQKSLRIKEVGISDKIEQLNNTATVTMSDENVTLLTAEGIL
jgi:hypothetical protein